MELLLKPILVVGVILGLAACEPINLSGGGSAPSRGEAVPVALLVPGRSGDSQQDALAQSLENAARLAIADLDGVAIDLRVYNTAGSPEQAAISAREAVDQGADIILGPLFAESANAAGNATAPQGVNVLAFSNNPAIAGGNVFILGSTFANTAERLVNHAKANGKSRIFVVHAESIAEEVARDAVLTALARSGITVAGVASFELSQQGVVGAIPGIAQQIKQANADAIIFTSGNEGAMSFLAQLLPENGISPTEIQFIGMARLDIPPQAMSQPGLQDSWFVLPDPGLNDRFRARYQTAYGAPPIEIAGRAYDGIAAIGALAQQNDPEPFGRASLTRSSGFVGVDGIFRLKPDGTNERGLAVAQIRNNMVSVIDPAPRRFAGPGF